MMQFIKQWDILWTKLIKKNSGLSLFFKEKNYLVTGMKWITGSTVGIWRYTKMQNKNIFRRILNIIFQVKM